MWAHLIFSKTVQILPLYSNIMKMEDSNPDKRRMLEQLPNYLPERDPRWVSALAALNHQAVEKLYSLFPRDVSLQSLDMDGDGGGAYGHLSLTSMEKLLLEMAHSAEFGRSSVFFDVGAGMGMPCLHAATAYCHAAVGVEIERNRVFHGAKLAQSFFRSGSATNHRVALIKADILKCRVLGYVSHVFIYDTVFTPELYWEVIKWVACSTCQYVVTFKSTRYPSLLKDTLSILGGTEVAKVSGLAMAGCGNQMTARIIKRDPPIAPLVYDDGTDTSALIDTQELASPFFDGDAEITGTCYEGLAVAHFPSSSRRRRKTSQKK